MSIAIANYIDKTHLIKLNHTEATIRIEVYPEHCLLSYPNDFDYGSEEENKKELARFESGELLNCYIVVKASACGCTGGDTLGQVFVTSNNLQSDILNCVAEHDMKNNACAELIEVMSGVRSALNNAFEVKQ